MRDYLQRAYGVGVLAVRSFVEQQKVTRMKSRGRFGYGPLRRPQSKKRMTVEMKEPFVWPEAPKEMDKYVVFALALPSPFTLAVVAVVCVCNTRGCAVLCVIQC